MADTGGSNGWRRLRRTAAVLLVLGLVTSGCRWSPDDDRTPGAVATRIWINAILDRADREELRGDTEAAERLRAAAEAMECRRFRCRPDLGTTTVDMDPSRAEGFFSMPWPSDTRRKADGSLDLGGFPGRDTIALANTTLTNGEATTFGFGTNAGVYFQTTAALAPSSLPGPGASTGRRSTVMLVDLDHPWSAPAPLLVDFKADGTSLRPANLLTLLPYPGHPLRERTRYAAVLFAGLTDTTHHRLAASPLIGQLDGDAPAGTDPALWQRLRDDRDATRRAVRAGTLWHPSQIVAFSVFTTQDTTGDMAAITRAVEAAPAPEIQRSAQVPQTCAPDETARFYDSRLDLPRWQAGTPPFLDTGGGIVVDPDGAAVRQGTENVSVDIVVPCAPAPPGGWPILLFMNGTGARADASSIGPLGHNMFQHRLPYVVLAIAPLFSGDRAMPGLPPEFNFFNYFNPLAGRTNQLRQAADMLWLKRAAQQLTFGPAEAGGEGNNAIDHGTVVMAGHSQGALTLPMTLASDPTITGGYLSSGGAGLYHSLVHRGDIRELLDGILGAEPGEIDRFHPWAHVLQTFGEAGDAANYGHLVDGPDVVAYGGVLDGCSTIEVSMHLAQTLGIPVANRLTRHPLFGSAALEPEAVELPVSENLPGGRTGVLVQSRDGHYGANAIPSIGRSFVDSIAAGGPTTEDPGPLDAVYGRNCGARADPPPI
jgi:hypothetical protein